MDTAEEILKTINILDNKEDKSPIRLAILGLIEIRYKHLGRALEYLRQLSKDGCIEASYLSGLILHKHQIEKDYRERAIEYFTIAGKAGNTNALYHLGQIFDSNSDYSKAKEYYETAIAIDRHPGALNSLGTIYYYGKDRDLSKAKELWAESMQAGNETARDNLLDMFKQEIGVDMENYQDKALLAIILINNKKCSCNVSAKLKRIACSFISESKEQAQELENIVKYGPESEEYKSAMTRYQEKRNHALQKN